LHSSQNSSQFEFDGIPNKNQNIFGGNDLGTINEENPISPIKLNFKDESKKISWA
jgi:vacuolar-type H+-ATPase catalytic subunit A/Vma1